MNYTSNMQTKINRRSLPKGWQWAKLGEICEINPRRPVLDRADTTLTTFVQMSAVDDLLGVITRPEQRPFSEIKKGYTYFSENDVIFAKITPCMENGKHAIANNLIDGIGFGSTEFHVIRPNEKIIAEWIWYFVRQPHVLQNATNYFTGAVGQQRVPDSYLKNLEIPLPPLDEQRRVAKRLNGQMAAVESARRAAEEQLQAARQLPSAYLKEVFDENHFKKWQWDKLGKHVTKVGSGITPSGGQASYLPSGIPLIRSQNVHMNRFSYNGLAFISKEQDGAMAGSRVFPNDVLLNITGASIGRVCVVPKETCPANVNQHVSIIRCDDKILPEFLSLYLSRPDFQKSILDMQAGATRQALTKALIENFDVPIPGIQEQKSIVDLLYGKMKETDVLIDSLESQLAEINRLPASLLREEFAGR